MAKGRRRGRWRARAHLLRYQEETREAEERRQQLKAEAARLEAEELSKQLFVTHMKYTASASEIKVMFSAFGEVRAVTIVTRASQSGGAVESTGRAVVAMADALAAKAVLDLAPRGVLQCMGRPGWISVAYGPRGLRGTVSVRPNRVSRTKAHRKSGGSYTLQLTRLRVGSLMVQQQQQQSLPQRAGQGTLVAEVLVEAATRLELTIDFECRSLEVIVPGSSPALHALMGPSWAGTGAGALLLKLRWKFKDVRACLVPTACGGLLLSVKQPPWVSRGTASLEGSTRFAWPMSMEDEDSIEWRLASSLGVGQAGGAVGRCMSYVLSLHPDAVAYLTAPNSMLLKRMLDFDLILRGVNFSTTSQASIRLACVDVAREQVITGLQALDEELRSLQFPLALHVLCMLSTGVLHMWQLVRGPGGEPSASQGQGFFELLRQAPYRHACQALSVLCARGGMPLERPAPELRRMLEGEGAQRMAGVPVHEDDALAQVWRLELTPTRLVVRLSEPELTNRVLRSFTGPGGLDMCSLVRMQMSDERGARLFGAASSDIFKQMQDVVAQGITLAGRPFEFLAFSSSQLKEQSLWMLACRPEDKQAVHNILMAAGATRGPCGGSPAAMIREWMGEMSHIKVPAKAAARMGQCFSTTHKTLILAEHEMVRIPDIERNGYCFTDGAGEISRAALQGVLHSMRTRLKPHELDGGVSAVQIRLGGAKGVLSLNPLLTQSCVRLRPSQIKFETGAGPAHRALEVVTLARRVPYYLNRHAILLLANNGVPTEVFIDKQEAMVLLLNGMTEDCRAAAALLPRLGGVDCLAMLLHMLEAQYSPKHEPLLRQCLLAVRAAALAQLQLKARILVNEGAVLVGAPDETGTLEEGCVFLQVRESRNGSSYLRVITGSVVIIKHPSMHPGDVRVMRAVDQPQLRHHVHELIFSVAGSRPASNMMPGSDMDGDQYAVAWDTSLIPTKPNRPAMDYTAAKPKEVDAVTPVHLLQHFFNHAINDNLGMIANAWLGWADEALQRAKDIMDTENCLELAKLHSIAVDFAKSGVPAQPPPGILRKPIPHWLDPAGSADSPNTYKSTTVVGQLYDAVTSVSSMAQVDNRQHAKELRQMFGGYGTQAAGLVDARVLAAAEGWVAWLPMAWGMHEAYERGMLELMNRYGVYNEGELLTGCIARFNKLRKRRAHETREALLTEVNALCNSLRRKLLTAVLQQRRTPASTAAAAAAPPRLADLVVEVGLQAPDVRAAAAALYCVTYDADHAKAAARGSGAHAGEGEQGCSSSDSDDSGSSSEGSSSVSGGAGAKQRSAGLLGLPWVAAADVLAGLVG